MSKGFETFTIRAATAEFPRESEGTAVELADGRVLMIWQQFLASEFAGEDNGLSRLVCAESADGGRTWGNERVLVSPGPEDVNVYSPNLIRLAPEPDCLAGPIAFLFMHYHRLYPISTTGEVWLSRDEGESFEPFSVAWDHRPWGLCASSAKRLSSGRLLVPMCVPRSADESGMDHWLAGSIYSDDGGQTWSESANWVDARRRGCMEPHVEELAGGRLLMVMRTQLGAVYQCHSEDDGVTWTKPVSMGLNAPESCPELVKLPGGELLLVWNNGAYDPRHYSHRGKRTPLSLAVSRDDGVTWGPAHDIETDPDTAYTNPGAVVLSNGTVFLNYWSSKYEPSGQLGIERIDLRGAIVSLDWLLC